jgi:hypothetical protein
MTAVVLASVRDGGFAVTLRSRYKVVRGGLVWGESRYVSRLVERYSERYVVAMACAAMDECWKSEAIV